MAPGPLGLETVFDIILLSSTAMVACAVCAPDVKERAQWVCGCLIKLEIKLETMCDGYHAALFHYSLTAGPFSNQVSMAHGQYEQGQGHAERTCWEGAELGERREA